MTRKINESGLALIKKFEGLRLVCYDDGVGVATIGYGHTKTVQLRDIGKKKITEQQAEELLKEDITSSERAVERYITIELNNNQFAALVSFTFNLGAGSLRTSTLRRKLNAGDYDSIPSELARWVNAGGKRLEGLVKRRHAEAELFITVLNDAPVATEFTSPHRLDIPAADAKLMLKAYLSDPSVILQRGNVDDSGAVRYSYLMQNVPDGYVIDFQTDLLTLGFNEIELDGVFGMNTRTALKKFQAKAAINKNGIVDTNSKNAIILWLKQGYSKNNPPAEDNRGEYQAGVKQMIFPMVPHYSQGDARWGSRVLGRSSSISQQGCAISSIAMILSFYGRDADPGSLDVFLDNAGGYSGNSVHWNAAAQFNRSGRKKLKYYRKTGSEAKLVKIIKKNIRNNLPTMARVDYGKDNDLKYNHFVVCVGIADDGSILMNDPATRYGNAYDNSSNDNIIQKTTRKQGYNIVGVDYYKPVN